MPRQTRRARLQPGARKRTTPLIPRHLLERAGPATLEPSERAEPKENGESEAGALEELEAAPQMAAAPRIERGFVPPVALPTTPAKPASGFSRRAQPVEKSGVSLAARLASTDYGYVVGELKRIFITAAVIVILLVVVTLLRR